jgi:uncharacterized protein YjbI with pentapeptide repeats
MSDFQTIADRVEIEALRGEWANLGGAHLEGAILFGAHLEGARASADTSWPNGFDWKAAKWSGS